MRQYMYAVEAPCNSEGNRRMDAWRPVGVIEAPHLTDAMVKLKEYVEGLDQYYREGSFQGSFRLVRKDDIHIVDYERTVESTVTVDLKVRS